MKISYNHKFFFKKILLPVSFFTILLLFISCNSYETSKSNINESFKKIALEKYKTNISYKFSPDSNYVVCFRTETQDEASGIPQLRFFIFDLEESKIIYEDNTRTESFSWIDNSKLKVLKRPGIITGDPKKDIKLMGYIYDLRQNKKLPLDTAK